jgi:hypothetical protein
MKKNSLVRVILTCLAIMLFAGMAMGSSWLGIGDGVLSDKEKKEYDESVVRKVNYEVIGRCTGSCLTREEMEQKISEYEKVQMEYSNKEIKSESDHILTVPELRLVMPDEHEYDENTRYRITALSEVDPHTNPAGFTEGLQVEVMDDTSACKIEEAEPQETTEPVETAGLPVEEIVGTYVVKADVTVSAKDKDDKAGEGTEIGSTEMEFTYIIAVVDGNKISIETQGIKAAEGVYNPTTGICDFKTSQDRTERFTFSKQDGQVQFKSIQLGKEDAVPAIGIKIE